jgi:hypothetical protein
MKIKYLDLVASLNNTEAVFDAESQLPANRFTAVALAALFREKHGGRIPEAISKGVLYRDGTSVCHFFPSARDCDPRLHKAARAHVAAFYMRDLGTQSETKRYIRDYVSQAIGRKGSIYEPPTTPLTLADKIKLLELSPKANRVFNYQRAVGVEIEGTAPIGNEELADRLPFYARVVSDGSIRTIHQGHQPAEIRILLDRARFESRLERVCKALGTAGFKTNRSCGLHVHLDARHLNITQRQKTQRIMTKWLQLLVELVPPSRRENSYCFLDLTHGRYCAVSVQTGGKDTIEVRLHSATIDTSKITMWIRLLELLAVLPNPKATLQTTLTALESLPLCEWDKNYWRQRHRQLNPGSYPATGTTTEDNE